MSTSARYISTPLGDALEQRGFFREFYDHTPDLLASVRTDLAKVAYCNQTLCRRLGWRREQVVGADLYSICHANSHSEMKRVWRDFLAHGEAFSKGLNLLQRDGSAIPVSLRIVASRDSDGRIVRGECTFRDVVDDQELERLKLGVRLQTVQKTESIALLTNSVAHDFNNLLIAILGNADLAKRKAEPGSAIHSKLGDIGAAARQAADLTRQLMTYSAAESPDRTDFELGATVSEISRLLEVSLAKRAAFDCQLHKLPVRVHGHVTQIRQVIMNLLINSAEAVDPLKGKVVLRTSIETVDREALDATLLGEYLRPGAYGVLEVVDNGIGLNIHQQREMFDPFFTTKKDGHGLGLAAVLNIVRAHGGTLSVTSAPGFGTTMKVLLPLSAADQAGTSTEHAPRQAGGEHVLLVDDEALVRDVAIGILESRNFVVTPCKDGYDAMAMYEAVGDTVDVVLIDLNMPGCDGITLYRWLRQRSSEQRIVMMSGLKNMQPASLKSDRNVTFLQKPFDGGSLIDAVLSDNVRPDATP